jgi:hypothetical protein
VAAINLTWKPDSWKSLSEAADEFINPVHHVYVIARKSDLCTVRVGQTSLPSNRFEDHDDDERIQDAANRSPVVKWARTDPEAADGVERYLFDELAPLVGEDAPDVEPRSCNLPEGASSGIDVGDLLDINIS